MTGPAWWSASRLLRTNWGISGAGQQKLKYMFMCRVRCMLNPLWCQVSHLHLLTLLRPMERPWERKPFISQEGLR